MEMEKITTALQQCECPLGGDASLINCGFVLGSSLVDCGLRLIA